MKLKSVIPWVWTGLVSAASLALFLSPAFQRQSLANQAGSLTITLAVVLITALGSLIATKRPGNRISWLFFTVSFGLLAAAVLSPLTETEPVSPTFWHYLALVVFTVFAVATIFYPLFLLLYVFPTGHFLTRRWTWAGWFGAIMVPTLLFLAVFSEEMSQPFDQVLEPAVVAVWLQAEDTPLRSTRRA